MTKTPPPKPQPTATQTAQGCGCLLVVFVGLAIGLGLCTSSNKPTASTTPLPPVQFGVGDDAAAWLSRCDPPESDTTTAYDNPRPPIVTRSLSYSSKGVRILLVPKDVSMGTPPPYSAWKLMGVTDPSNNQPIEPSEALRRMGSACRT
jgi:hypothetical protein